MSRRLELASRLAMLAQLVPGGCRLADIGSDHGYLPVWLLQEGRISFAIATDIRPEPLAHARSTAVRYGTDSQMDFRLCDGLAGVRPEEAEVIVIAGMGAENICGILSAATWLCGGAYTLLLQPMSKSELLRRWLSQNGYTITEEFLVLDKGIIYPVLSVVPVVTASLTDLQCYVGLLKNTDPLAEQWLCGRVARLRREAEGLMRAGEPAKREQAAPLWALAAQIQFMKEGLSCQQHEK